MAIDFTMTREQAELKYQARAFAREVLKPAVHRAETFADPHEVFQAMRPVYEQAAAAGFTTMFLPREYGGGGATHVDFLIAIEELCAVDPGFPTILLINGLALMPILWLGTEEQRQRFLTRATEQPNFLAGWVVSERGGTANFDHPSPAAGIQLLAERRPDGQGYLLNGEKHWPGNAGGWDLQGADINVCVAREDLSRGAENALSLFVVERGTPGIDYEVIDKLAHRTCQNVTMTFHDVKVPEENVLAHGQGDLLINRNFTWSSPIAAIAAVAVARSAYEFAHKWARTFTGGGTVPIIEHQAIGHLLADVAARIEAGRYFCWKAAHYIDCHPGQGHALGGMNKTFCGDLMQSVVFDCMRIVGVNALDTKFPMAKLYREAVVFPLYDAGNLAMQRRRTWGVMTDKGFSVDTFVDNEPFEFTRSMQGFGVQPRPY